MYSEYNPKQNICSFIRLKHTRAIVVKNLKTIKQTSNNTTFAIMMVPVRATICISYLLFRNGNDTIKCVIVYDRTWSILVNTKESILPVCEQPYNTNTKVEFGELSIS